MNNQYNDQSEERMNPGVSGDQSQHQAQPGGMDDAQSSRSNADLGPDGTGQGGGMGAGTGAGMSSATGQGGMTPQGNAGSTGGMSQDMNDADSDAATDEDDMTNLGDGAGSASAAGGAI